MSNAKRFPLVVLAIGVLAMASCGENDEGVGGGGTPRAPLIGEQIERMGRAAINTALSSPFASEEERGDAEDAYNAAANPIQWTSMFTDGFAANLAIFDGLDRNCGNQLLAGDEAVPGRYDALASVLADDQLYVNTEFGTCQTYLAVEANALGIVNDDCGGRTPLYDTIDVSYSVLAAGALSGVGDGIPLDADSEPSITELPFYAEPNS